MYRGRQLQREISASVWQEHDREEHRSTWRIDLDSSVVLKRYDRHDVDEAIRLSDRAFRPFIIGCLVVFTAAATMLLFQGGRFELLAVVVAAIGLTLRGFPKEDAAVRTLTAQCLANLKAVSTTPRH